MSNTIDVKTTNVGSLASLAKSQEAADKLTELAEKTTLKVADVKKTLPKVNTLSPTLLTLEVDKKEVSDSLNFDEVKAVNKHNIDLFYKQITHNLLIGAKSIFLVCRDLVDASKTLSTENFEVLKELLPMSEATISKYMKVGASTTCKQLFQMNRLPESWTTMYKIATIKDDDKRKDVVAMIEKGTTANEVEVFLTGAKNELAPIFKYEKLVSPRDFIKVGIEGYKDFAIDPNAMELIKKRVEKVVEQSLKEIGNVKYAVAKKAKPATAEVVFNKQLYDKAMDKTLAYFKKLKSDGKKLFTSSFYNKQKEIRGELATLMKFSS